MIDRVYKNYSQQQLDAEYDNSAKVKNAAKIIRGYTKASADYRQTAAAEFDVRYGNSADETLDIFYANGDRRGTSRPVHVFFHGGYWRAMHKDDFSFVAAGLCETSAICVVVNYALIPQVTMDQLVAQCRQSLAWLFRNVAQFGGDPKAMTLCGHSAGGHLVGMMIATDWSGFEPGCPPNLVKAGVALSGLFDLEPIRLSYLNDTLGLDKAGARRNSPLYQKNLNDARLSCCFGALEGDEYRRQSESLAIAWETTSALAVADHDHFSICHDLNSPASTVSQLIKGQISTFKTAN